jgi:hypothetical protein
MNKSEKIILHLLLFLFCPAANAQVDSEENLKAFMEESIEFERYVFHPGDFPEFKWHNETAVQNQIGEVQLKADYFDKDFRKVTLAENPGRYGALIEGVTSSGFIVRRYVTLFCSEAEFDDYSKNVPVRINKIKEYNIPDKNWDTYFENEGRFSFGAMKFFPQQNADAAVFLAGLSEMDTAYSYESPRIKDRQWWITFKQKLERISLSAIKDPGVMNNISLNEDKSYDLEKINAVRNICLEWTEKGGSPNVTLILHKGKIVFHEAFGSDEEGKPVTKDSKMWMASITKLLTGLVMMQFVDQGLVELDAPVGRYLPEIKDKRISVRDLFTHTTGLQFAGEWASDWNHALENQAAHLLSSIELNKTFSYNRVGYALAGKIMERLTGRTMPYLFYKYIFYPLNMTSAYSENTYGGLYCTAYDLALLGEVLLHKGSFKNISLFSEKSFEKMLPVNMPGSKEKRGIGTSNMGDCGLSDSAFGHSAGSGSVFRIDPKNDLVIISARNTPGKFHSKYECSLIEKCLSLIENH